MATLDFTIDTLQLINENLITISGQLVLGAIEPNIAFVHVNGLKNVHDTTIKALHDSYNLSTEDFQKVTTLSLKVKNNFSKVESFIKSKTTQKADQSQNQPE